MIPPRWTPGDKLSIPRMEAERSEVVSNRDLKVDMRTGLELVKFPWGQLLRRSQPETIWGTLSGSGPTYTFVEAEDSGGTWGSGPTSGTAYEVNGVTGLSGTRQELHPDRLGAWRFQAIRFGSVGPSTCPVTISNCFCNHIPSSLSMFSADQACNFSMFQSCTLSYGPHPGFSAFGLGTNYFLSDQSFTDPALSGAVFWYSLSCQFDLWKLTRNYLTSPLGSPFQDGILYTWHSGATGNSCPGNAPYVMNSAYLTWAACADTYLNANAPPSPPRGPWDLEHVVLDAPTGCLTGDTIAAVSGGGFLSPGVWSGLVGACGLMPPLILPVSGGNLALINGAAFPGSDPTCHVEITG